MLCVLIPVLLLNILTDSVLAETELKIVTSPKDVTQWVGEFVKLSCELQLTGDENALFYWKQGGVELGAALCNFPYAGNSVEDAPMECQGEFTGRVTATPGETFTTVKLDLTLQHVNTSHVGEYRCGATAGTESVRSAYVNLNAIFPPSCSLGLQSNSRVFTENDKIILNCDDKNNGDPRSTLSWSSYLTGMPHRQVDPKYVQYLNSTSSFSKFLTTTDNGRTMECTYRHPNINTEKTCSIGPLTVMYAPKIAVKQVNISTNSSYLLNNHKVYKCEVDANPKSDLEWFIDGKPFNSYNISDRIIVSGDGDVLHVLDDLSQESTYVAWIECRASNTIGQYSDTFQYIGQHYSTSTDATECHPDNNSPSSDVGLAIACLFVGLLVGIGICALVFCFILKRRSSKDEESNTGTKKTPRLLSALSNTGKRGNQKNRYEFTAIKGNADDTANPTVTVTDEKQKNPTPLPSPDNGVYTDAVTVPSTDDTYTALESHSDDYYEPIHTDTQRDTVEEVIYENTENI